MQVVETFTPRQTALPIPNGRLAMWLFLSTEVMFFAALIGTYLIFRMGAGDRWPTTETVHLSPWLGGCNTLVLVISSISLGNAARMARQDRWSSAKSWLALAIVLGVMFLGVKGYEYREKMNLGLLPGASKSLLHDQADIYYLAHVKESMSESSVAETASEVSSKSGLETGKRTEQTPAWQKATLLGLVQWAEQELANTTDEDLRSEVLIFVAETIYPVGAASNVSEAMSEELSQLSRQIENLADEQQYWEGQLARFQSRIQSLEAPPETADVKEPNQDAVELTEQKALAANATERLTRFKLQRVQKLDRRSFLEMYLKEPPQAALDEKVDRALPKVIVNGQTWSSNYFLLTGCHALHVLAGLLVMIVLLAARVGSAWSEWLRNTALYWHFVDCVWLVLFPLIYLVGF